MSTRGEVGRLDAELARQARLESALRLRLGQALEVLSRGGHFELGFSSMGAYALERCARSVRWAEGARCLARRLEGLPGSRRSVALGELSWSKAELVASVAQADDEDHWVEVALGHTVRELRELVSEVASRRRTTVAFHASTDAVGESCTLVCAVDREEAWLFASTRTLLEHLGVSGISAQVDALLAEAQGALLDALPAQALETGAFDGEMLASGGVEARWREQLDRWRAEAEALCERQFRAPVLASPGAESALVAHDAAPGIGSLESATARQLDSTVQGLAQALARHELELSGLILLFHRADGWRRLGYASETQYARERLGMSRSSVLARRALALRLNALPALKEALGHGQVGVEAALQVARVAVPSTEAAWVERARHRTVKHLREEVAAALVAVRLSGDAECPPPADVEMDGFQRLERAVVSGKAWRRSSEAHTCESLERFGRAACVGQCAACRSLTGMSQRVAGKPGDGVAQTTSPVESRRAWHVMLASLARWLEIGLEMGVQTSAAQVPAGIQMSAARAPAGVQMSAAGNTTRSPTGARAGVQMSADFDTVTPSMGSGSGVQMSAARGPTMWRATSSAGRVELRWRVSRATRAWWRGLETLARRWLPGTSWLTFACHAVWRAWRHLLGADMAYGRVYIRDRFRCTSPVCNRKDVTPHHLRFRSAGGSDEDVNVAAVCTWCHLFGVHGGRIRAVGSAAHIRWELGARGDPCLVVCGRERMAA